MHFYSTLWKTACVCVQGGTNGFALKASDATQGQLKVMYDGPRPNGYQPMKKQVSRQQNAYYCVVATSEAHVTLVSFT
jgi:hypothetical protein